MVFISFDSYLVLEEISARAFLKANTGLAPMGGKGCLTFSPAFIIIIEGLISDMENSVPYLTSFSVTPLANLILSLFSYFSRKWMNNKPMAMTEIKTVQLRIALDDFFTVFFSLFIYFLWCYFV
ncbi:MAG: hypothetical protein A2390_00670 [Candidatus Liptonbacteria bacterium RIFOXYB1_FULL_36_10]|uniref:Uncharacterized protein n=1 Tax=Candidatus Liptonbacteria bacterium RIFOXYB1_FULL_36_10 TaxID=1798654 RepID=A0A1G2CQ84_9BACT|nr:MAG: hypothetical protein A2390_00670 [Candidatus Liptonbacteria bacterium RIFOXYB1_FULL_36_10]